MKKTNEICALLGEDTEFNGVLKFYGTMRVDGNFTGEIRGEGALMVGEKGKLDSNIRVSQIDISGEVKGNILADQRIEIRPSGKVYGDMLAPVVVINEGAIFEGNCRTRVLGQQEEGETESHPMPEVLSDKQTTAGVS